MIATFSDEDKLQKPARKAWGQARIEVLALLPDILAMLDKGYSVTAIHRHFEKAGKVTVGRRQFADRLAKSGDKTPIPPPTPSQAVTPPQTAFNWHMNKE